MHSNRKSRRLKRKRKSIKQVQKKRQTICPYCKRRFEFSNGKPTIVICGQTNDTLFGSNSPVELPYFHDKTRKLEYLERLVSKQLDLYDWCEEKVSTLATIDSILLGGATLFIDKVKIVSDAPDTKTMFINGGIGILLIVPFFISLAIALWHIRPKMGTASTHATRPNHRSSNGIHRFVSQQEYDKNLAELKIDELCDDLSKQIYGMNNNIWKNQKSIKTAVVFDLIGLIGFMLAILFYAVFV